jgi:hypothetical protein
MTSAAWSAGTSVEMAIESGYAFTVMRPPRLPTNAPSGVPVMGWEAATVAAASCPIPGCASFSKPLAGARYQSETAATGAEPSIRRT